MEPTQPWSQAAVWLQGMELPERPTLHFCEGPQAVTVHFPWSVQDADGRSVLSAGVLAQDLTVDDLLAWVAGGAQGAPAQLYALREGRILHRCERLVDPLMAAGGAQLPLPIRIVGKLPGGGGIDQSHESKPRMQGGAKGSGKGEESSA